MNEVRRSPEDSAPEGNDALAGGGEMGALMRSMDWSGTTFLIILPRRAS